MESSYGEIWLSKREVPFSVCPMSSPVIFRIINEMLYQEARAACIVIQPGVISGNYGDELVFNPTNALDVETLAGKI